MAMDEELIGIGDFMNMVQGTGAAVLFSWLAPASVLAQGLPHAWGSGMHSIWMGAWGVGMMLMMFIFCALFIAAAVLAVRWLWRQGKTPQSHAALEKTQPEKT